VGVLWLHDITGDLQSGELVIGQVLIEGVDQPVAIGPGVIPRFVVFEAVAFTETHHIQPVSCPALAVVR